VSKKKEPPLDGQLYATIKNWTDSAALDKSDRSGTNETITTDIEAANVITSMMTDKVTHHKVIIDLDIPAKLVPSTTPGHFHLYIDHELEKEAYFALLTALAEAGLIEPGYLGASKNRGYTAVRLPWVKKEKADETAEIELQPVPL
jgi:CRISPR/Cas system CSM-associated protein Csm3 (group 7 of RAMP superfamily)